MKRHTTPEQQPSLDQISKAIDEAHFPSEAVQPLTKNAIERTRQYFTLMCEHEDGPDAVMINRVCDAALASLSENATQNADVSTQDAYKEKEELERHAYQAMQILGAAITGEDHGCHVGNLAEMAREVADKLKTAQSAKQRSVDDTARIAALQQAVAAKQAHIDRLMLEYCPQDMTPLQIEEWKKHQRAATPEEETAINAALDGRKA